jgi:hypothetical protein
MSPRYTRRPPQRWQAWALLVLGLLCLFLNVVFALRGYVLSAVFAVIMAVVVARNWQALMGDRRR